MDTAKLLNRYRICRYRQPSVKIYDYTIKMNTPRSNFDGIVDKFDQNIYGTSKGRLRHELLLHFLSSTIESAPMDVLDLGGGSGVMALEFAKRGHKVTIFDISNDILTTARQRLQAYPNTQFVLGDVNDIQASIKTKFDFVICHALLEWLNEPFDVLDKIPLLLTRSGRASLSFFNHDAKVFSNLLYANFDYVEKGLPAKNTVRLNPHNAQKPTEVLAYLTQKEDVNILQSRGIRCFHDYIMDKSKIETHYQQLLEMEIKFSDTEPYKWLGKYFHIMLQAR